MPFFPQLPEIKTPQLFKGDIPTLLKDISQLKNESQLRKMRDIAIQKETAPPSQEIGSKEQLEIDLKKIKKSEALMNLGLERLKTVTSIDEYNIFKEGMLDLGVSPGTIPNIETDEELKQYKDDIRQEITLWKGKAGKGTPLQKLYSQLDTEKNPLRKKQIQKAIKKEIGSTPETEELTLYHEDGKRTKRITRVKGTDFDPAAIYGKGWSQKVPASVKGELSEEAVRKDMREMFNWDSEKVNKGWGKFLDYTNPPNNLSRAEALEKVMEDMEIVRTGTYQGQRVVEYADGTIEFED